MSTVGIYMSQRRRGASITEEMEELMEPFWVSGVEASQSVDIHSYVAVNILPKLSMTS